VAAAESIGEIEVDGRRVGWRAVGRGPELLLINGYAATSRDWDPTFLARLARSHRVICPDNRGLGGSELGDAELAVDGMAADLEALLDALEIDRVPVVGWSMGGFIAQRLALRSPGRVATLTLIATDPGGPGAIRSTPEVWVRLIDRSGTPREQASRLISLLFPADLAKQIDRRFGDAVAAARAELPARAMSAQEAAMAAWHGEDQPPPAAGAVPPTLIVHGDDDVVIPAGNAGRLAQRWPGARVELFEGCAHAVMAQEPRRVAAAIDAHTV
jgi:3-oxoadipate enol-lactonase